MITGNMCARTWTYAALMMIKRFAHCCCRCCPSSCCAVCRVAQAMLLIPRCTSPAAAIAHRKSALLPTSSSFCGPLCSSSHAQQVHTADRMQHSCSTAVYQEQRCCSCCSPCCPSSISSSSSLPLPYPPNSAPKPAMLAAAPAAASAAAVAPTAGGVCCCWLLCSTTSASRPTLDKPLRVQFTRERSNQQGTTRCQHLFSQGYGSALCHHKHCIVRQLKTSSSLPLTERNKIGSLLCADLCHVSLPILLTLCFTLLSVGALHAMMMSAVEPGSRVCLSASSHVNSLDRQHYSTVQACCQADTVIP